MSHPVACLRDRRMRRRMRRRLALARPARNSPGQSGNERPWIAALMPGPHLAREAGQTEPPAGPDEAIGHD